MILLPIGHDEGRTRRVPWGTFAIMILCGAAFVATGFGGSRTDFEAIGAIEQAAEYWDVWGPPLFAGFYLACGAGAALDPTTAKTAVEAALSRGDLDAEGHRQAQALRSRLGVASR